MPTAIHITTLLLTFFFRIMMELIRKGHLYIAQPPLYRIDVGKETHFDARRRPQGSDPGHLRPQRQTRDHSLKGLGEMAPQDARRTTLDPKPAPCCKSPSTRNLEADKTFVELLGKDSGIGLQARRGFRRPEL